MIFQEPMTSLSPLHTVGDQVSEALLLHGNVGKAEALDRAVDVFARVGFPDPARGFDAYPFELSGGLRQRAMIAVALAARPSVLIADEPTTALDVTVQAQVLGLMRGCRARRRCLLLLTHDLGVVATIADDVVAMYRGRVVERGAADDVFRRARHPYFNALLRAVPGFAMAPGERLTPIREAKRLSARRTRRHRPGPSRKGPLLAVAHRPRASRGVPDG